MSYEIALEAAGCTVIEYVIFGSYQGEWLALVDYNGQRGIIEGCYGSCSGCDAFEAEFGWHDDEHEDYHERLKSFGEGYLPALPIDHYIYQLEKRVAECEWDSEAQEMLDQVKHWSNNQ